MAHFSTTLFHLFEIRPDLPLFPAADWPKLGWLPTTAKRSVELRGYDICSRREPLE